MLFIDYILVSLFSFRVGFQTFLKKNEMASLLHSAFNSMTSWLADDHLEEDGNYKFYCDSERLIELIVEKARDLDTCVDIEQKEDDDVVASPHHKCPSPAFLRSSKIQPKLENDENFLTERLLRDRAESGDLGVRVGDGVLSLKLITAAADGSELLLKRVDNASASTLKNLAEIPQYCSTILAVCFDATRDDLDKLENAVKGASFCWKLGPIADDDCDSAANTGKRELTDQDFEAFIAVARATVVLHVIQTAGF